MTYLIVLAIGWPVREARGLAFTALLVSQAPLLVIERLPHGSVWRAPLHVTRELVVALTAIGVTIALMLYVPVVADLLGVAPFHAEWWLVVAAVATVCTLWSEPLKHERSRR